MWAYKFLNKDTRLQVPSFKTFMFQNQEWLQLWYEDETVELEDRVNFAMRCLRYSGHLFILFCVMIIMINSQDAENQNFCDRRLHCYSSCNRAFFPSLSCQIVENEVIELHGNRFDKFYKYPKPNYVKKNFQDPITVKEPAVYDAEQHQPKVGEKITFQTKYAVNMNLIAKNTFKKYQAEYDQCQSYAAQVLTYEMTVDGSGR